MCLPTHTLTHTHTHTRTRTHTHTHTHVCMRSGNHIERLHSKLTHLSYKSRWGHKRSSHKIDWNMQKFRFLVYTMIHGLTVRHTRCPHHCHISTSPSPPLPSQEEPQSLKWLDWSLNCKSNSFAKFHDDLKKEVCTDLCVLLLVVNNTITSRERDWTIASW